MDCETVLNRFFLLDKHETLPVGIRLHLLHCKTCRKFVSRMAAAESIPQRTLHIPIDNEERMLNAAMNAICQLNRYHDSVRKQEQPSALLIWLAVGLILIAGFVLLPFSDIGKNGLNQFGASFCIPFALLCAGSIVTYAAIFLAKNLVFFAEKFGLPQRMQ